MNKICVLGDFILDVYFQCKPRINPESNAPCFTALKAEMKIGGAGNVKENLEALGSEVDFFYSGERSTKLRVFDGNKHIFRLDDETVKYTKEELKQKEELLISDFLENSYDYVLVSDYNKGAITKKVAKVIMESKSKVIVDCKPNHFNWFKDCYLIKPNLKEFNEMKNPSKFEHVLVTKGKEGMDLLHKGKLVANFAPIKVKAVDVTGAGDTVISTLVHFLNKNYSLIESCKLANKAGAISVTHLGCYAVKEKEVLNFSK